MRSLYNPCTSSPIYKQQKMPCPLMFISFLLLLTYPSSILCRGLSSAENANLQTYIIHVQRPDNVFNSLDLESWYRSFLPQSPSDSQNSDRLVYAYSEVFPGFAARLTKEELVQMSEMRGFVRAFPDKIYPLFTSHTPDYLGLRVGRGVWNNSNLGKGVIVGVLDTGILPNHPSFNDDGIPPPPARWKGQCDFEAGCNNKIIGARTFTIGQNAGSGPVDDSGHGSHTASTIAGNFVKGLDPFGLGKVTMVGMAPHAHLAIYKVCDVRGCPSSAIVAGLDSAVKDRVDVLSLSLGGASAAYDNDPIAIGSFKAVEKGITVVCAGGNSGPTESSVSNDAPWILTVAASTVDRSFRSTVKLGDGTEIDGESFYQPHDIASRPVPLVFPTEGLCNVELGDDLKGKIVICYSVGESPASFVADAGGAGSIIIAKREAGHTLALKSMPIPGSFVINSDGLKIEKYATSADSPTASFIFNGTVLGTSPSPVIAYFSSRGPSQQSPGILKPDITAPGVNILAAWHVQVDEQSDVPFNIVSGTSMATPHVSGIAALIKSLHPDWSPAAIKSAIVTSSDYLDRDGNPIKDEQHDDASFFVSGAGHVNPSKAVVPGLVYETEIGDYIAYLCGVVGEHGISVFSNVSCMDVKNITDVELNYPTITFPRSSDSYTVNRTVTNVGAQNATYTAEVEVPRGINVTVKPRTLYFSKVNEKKTFSVTVSGVSASTPAQGNLKWVSGKTVVRSALVFTA